MPCLNPKKIDDFAQRHGCIIGVCCAEPLAREPYATGFTPFVSGDLKKRTHPTASLPGVRSIIVIGLGYEKCFDDNGKPFSMAELSALGQNIDYHVRVKKLLQKLVDGLREEYDFRYKILVDNPGLDERAFAVRAGLGFYGRHGLVVSPRFGSRFNIGLLLTDIPVETLSGEHFELNPPASACPPDCRRCIDACPTGALGLNRRLDSSRCISYLTQKDELTPEEEKLLNNQLYGCDICQDACPFNAPRGKTYINPTDWLTKTDEDFYREYGQTAILWRGVDILRRNARVL
jgi:epoxyqueuosine reductase